MMKKTILSTLLLATSTIAVAQPYDPTDPDQQQACIAWADDTYAWCLGIMCETEPGPDLIRRIHHCRGVWEHLSVCCSGFPPDPAACPEIPVP